MARKNSITILRILRNLKLSSFEKSKPGLKQKSLSWTKIGSGVIFVATTGSAFLYYSKLKLEQEEIKQEFYSISSKTYE